jgi:hypothetical protein
MESLLDGLQTIKGKKKEKEKKNIKSRRRYFELHLTKKRISSYTLNTKNRN